MSRMYRVHPHPTAPGRYCVANVELRAGDSVAFIAGNTVLQGHIVQDTTAGICVLANAQSYPLHAIAYARFVDTGRMGDGVAAPLLHAHRKATTGRLRHRRP